MTAASPRIAPGSRRDVGVPVWLLSRAAARVERTKTLNLFLTLGRHRKLFRGWLRFAGRLMPRGILSRRETELVILRVAQLRDCRYEYEHHVHRARRAGIGPAELDRLETGPDADGWSERERVVLAAVDELHERGDLTDERWAMLRAHLDEREAIELCMLVGHYEMLATVITTLRIQPDARRG